MLVPDGVYFRDAAAGRPRFVPVPAPGTDELTALVRTIAERVGRWLERAGLLTRDMENAYLAFDSTEEAPINGLIGHSITYRVATDPREGQKVLTLQALPPKARLCDRLGALRCIACIERCCRCGGRLTVIASIEEQVTIDRILENHSTESWNHAFNSALAAEVQHRQGL